MDEPVLETTGLLKRYGGTAVVDRIDLAVPRGEIYGFLGPNGAGKTTTIRMLLGLLSPDAGAVRLFGKPLAASRAAALARVGALVETPSLYPHLTGRENLEVTRRLLALPEASVTRALETAGLAHAGKKPVSGYSLGMKQRLGLALALLASPELLVLDEPTNGLDPIGIQTMRSSLRALASEQGVTVFLSSHLLSEVEQVATHVGVLGAGRLLFQGTREALGARLSPRLVVRAEPVDAALDALRKAGFRAERAGEPASERGAAPLTVDASTPADAARAASALVRAGVALQHLAVERRSLEEAFLDLTAAYTQEKALWAA